TANNLLSLDPTTFGGESSSHTTTMSLFVQSPKPSPKRKDEEPPSRLEGEKADMITKEQKEENIPEEEPKSTQPEPIQTIIPPT
nr:hypothetical protein [Tanacetum cinerariifolium]